MDKSAPAPQTPTTDFAGADHKKVGLFAQRFSFNDFTGRPALFLDRDGVIVEETNYLHRRDDVSMIAGVANAIAAANRAGIPIVVVTNQAGIGRGYYRWSDFHVVQRVINRELAHAGARADMVIACAYHENGVGDYASVEHPWRKPGPGMLLEAAEQLGIDLKSSFIVGDCITDMQAGARAGLLSGAMVETGHGKREWQTDGLRAFNWLEKEYGFKATLFEAAPVAIMAWLTRLSS